MDDEINILNVRIHNITIIELLKRLGSEGGTVVTPNVDHLMKLQKDPEFYEIYKGSTYRVCDSKILIYASKFLGQPIKEKISGSDLFPAFYDYYKDNAEMTIFLMGAAEGVAKRAQEKINAKVGREMIIESYSPPFGFDKDEVECQRIVTRINESGATVLAIGVGAPKQEKWIAKYRNQLKNVKVFLAIGATIDFEAGEKKRSPQWMSDWGVEWLHRLFSEPGRMWKRYLVEDIPFFWLLLLQKLKLYNPPFSTRQEFVNWESPLLGQLLNKAGLLSTEQVDKILGLQQKHPEKRFGDFVVELGWLERETVDFFAEFLPELALSKHRHPLGHYLYKAKLLDEAQIDSILEQQNQLKLRFGEVAVMKGWVKQQTLDTVLDYLTEELNDGSTEQLNDSSTEELNDSSAA
ncbi:MAG: WecB/TagA/CpsF family glycosyltransferase [Planktothrix sp.]